jgi:hypothetical protein
MTTDGDENGDDGNQDDITVTDGDCNDDGGNIPSCFLDSASSFRSMIQLQLTFPSFESRIINIPLTSGLPTCNWPKCYFLNFIS